MDLYIKFKIINKSILNRINLERIGVTNRKDPSIRTISNLIISNECYKKLKIMSVDKEVTLQEIIADILEKITCKHLNNIKSLEEMVKIG